MNSMLIGGPSNTYSLCSMHIWLHVLSIPYVQGSRLPGSICYGFSCASFSRHEFHMSRVLVCQSPFVMNSMLTGLHVRRVPSMPGSMLTGFYALCILCMPRSCVMSSMHAGFHACRAPCMPGSMHAGFLCVGLHLLCIPCMPDSMFYEFHACRAPCMLGYKYMLLVKVISIAGDIY